MCALHTLPKRQCNEHDECDREGGEQISHGWNEVELRMHNLILNDHLTHLPGKNPRAYPHMSREPMHHLGHQV